MPQATPAPAPQLSSSSEFHRTPQAARAAPKLTPQELVDKFSLALVAQQILDLELAKVAAPAPQNTCGSGCATDKENGTQCCKKDTTNIDKAPAQPPAASTPIALQFPDRLISESAYICSELGALLETAYTNAGAAAQALSRPRLYVLGDTSYSPCCVDVVAAQHIRAHTIVHFGTACLNPVAGAQVIYVFGKEPLACGRDGVVQAIREAYASDSEEVKRVAIVYDPEYAHEMEGFGKAEFADAPQDLPEIIDTQLVPPQDASIIIPPLAASDPAPANPSALDIPGRRVQTAAPVTSEGFLATGSVFYVAHGEPSPSYLLHLTTLCRQVFVLDGTRPAPARATAPTTSLQRRYRSMTVARTAATVGILVNTLALRDAREAVARVQGWVTAAGKKHYTFVVGKPSAPKLANFDVVDVWVVLGCPRGGIIMAPNGGPDPEYYKPVITPYELKMALMPVPTWTGKWAIQLENVLTDMKNLGLGEEEEEEKEEEIDDDESEAPVFDPVTGKYISTSRPLRTKRITHLDVTPDADDDAPSTGLVVRHSSHLVIRNTVSTAADHLYNKLTWTGLGSDFGKTDYDDDDSSDKRFAAVERGRGGVARGYNIVDTLPATPKE